MARYIVSRDSDGVITNLVEWDGLPTWAPPPGQTASRSDKPAQPGDIYVRATDTVIPMAPVPPAPSPDAAKTVTAAMSPYTVSDTDRSLLADTSGGRVQILMPSAPVDGREISIKKVTTDENPVEILGNGKTIDSAPGVASTAITRPSLTFRHSAPASDWKIVETFTGGLPQSAVLSWGAENIATAVDTRVMPPGYVTGVLNTNASRGMMMPRPGTLRNLTARHNAAAGNGQPVVYTIRKNGVPTALSVSLPAQAVGQAINRGVVQVAEGDLIELTRTIATAIGSGGVEVICTAEFQGAPLSAAVRTF